MLLWSLVGLATVPSSSNKTGLVTPVSRRSRLALRRSSSTFSSTAFAPWATIPFARSIPVVRNSSPLPRLWTSETRFFATEMPTTQIPRKSTTTGLEITPPWLLLWSQLPFSFGISRFVAFDRRFRIKPTGTGDLHGQKGVCWL